MEETLNTRYKQTNMLLKNGIRLIICVFKGNNHKFAFEKYYRHMKKTKISLAIVTLLLVIAGCNPSIYLVVERPAEVNLKGYKNITVGDIINENGKIVGHSHDIVEGLTTKLFESKIFNVIDRQNLNKILEEQKLGQSGIIDEQTAVELGNIMGSSVMVFGRIQIDKYEEKVSKDKPWRDKNGTEHQMNHRDGTYNYIVNLKLIDIETSKILATKTFDGTNSTRKSADNKPAPEIDKSGMYLKAMNSVVSNFIKMVAPYSVTVKASFEKDSDLPELEYAMILFKVGEWDEGIKILKEATQKQGLKPEVRAKAFYNYGTILIYRGQADLAIDMLKETMKLMPTKKKYQNALVLAKMEKEQIERLQEQK